MKAFLLAAGEGTRLRPLTLDTPKCLVPVHGIPLLEIWFRLLEKHGIGEVLINTHHLPDKVNRFLSGCRTNIKVHVVYEEELLGSGGTIKQNRDFISDDPFFWIIYADSLTNTDLGKLLHFYRKHPSLLTMGVFETDVPELSGIVTLDDHGTIIGFVEKPDHPPSRLSNTGIMIASAQFVDAIPDRVPCDLSVDVIPGLVGQMTAVKIDGFFVDIGTRQGYDAANRKWEEMAGSGFLGDR